MNKAQKRFYGAALTLSTVASVVAPVAVSAATVSYDDAKAKVDTAVATPVFSNYNKAYEAVMALTNKDQQAVLLAKLAPLWDKVATPYVKGMLAKMEALAKDKNLKTYNGLLDDINAQATDAEKLNQAYLLGELTAWGSTIQTKEETAAIAAINAAWADKSPANIAAAKDAIAKVTNAGSVEWLNAQVAEVVNNMATTVTEVKAVGAKKITVTFNKAVDTTKATLSLNKGVAPVAINAITWNDAKTQATIEAVIKYTSGDYTVKVAGLDNTVADSKVTLADETVQGIVITSTAVQQTATAPITYTIQNQYGESKAVTAADLTVTAYNIKNPLVTVTPIVGATDGSVKLDNHSSAVDDKVVVTITHNATGKSATATLATVAASKIGTLTLGNVVLPSGTTRLAVNNTTDLLKISYTAADQYGTTVKLNASETNAQIESVDGVKIISSDPTIINPANIKTNADKELTFQTTANSGTTVLTFVTLATGQSSSISVTVNAVPKTKTIAVVQPTTLVTVGAGVTVDYTATNQFSETIAKSDFASSYRTNITWVSTKTAAVDPATDITWNAQNQLIVTPHGTGTVTLTPYVDGIQQGSITLDVQAAIVPTKVVGVKDLTALAVKDGVIAVKASNLNVVDQYGNAVTLPSAWSAHLTLKDAVETSFDLGTNVDYTATSGSAITLSSDSTAYANFKALDAAGSETLKVVLVNASGSEVADSAYEFSITKVASDAVTSYAISDPGLFYGLSTNTTSGTWAKTISFVGKDAAGNKVALKPGTIDNLTSNSADFVVDSTNMKVTALKKSTATLTAWKGTTAVATFDVTSSDVAPVVTSVSFDKSSYDFTGSETIVTTIKDQYGVAISDANGRYYVSDTNVATVNAATGALTKVGVGTITLTYIAGSGVVKTATVNVK